MKVGLFHRKVSVLIFALFNRFSGFPPSFPPKIIRNDVVFNLFHIFPMVEMGKLSALDRRFRRTTLIRRNLLTLDSIGIQS